MSEGNNQGDAQALLYLFLAVAAGYVAIVIISLIGVILTICLTAAAVYFGSTLGYKLALDSGVWESRRIAKHQKIEEARKREKEYFSSQGQDWMVGFVDQHYDDQERSLYDQKDAISEAAKTVKKVKDIFH
jgi:ABC-type transport system involved in cytochrome bd biosynthesis fused ATPase/permease subunit